MSLRSSALGSISSLFVMQDNIADQRFPYRFQRIDIGEILFERSELLMQRLHHGVSQVPQESRHTLMIIVYSG